MGLFPLVAFALVRTDRHLVIRIARVPTHKHESVEEPLKPRENIEGIYQPLGDSNDLEGAFPWRVGASADHVSYGLVPQFLLTVLHRPMFAIQLILGEGDAW